MVIGGHSISSGSLNPAPNPVTWGIKILFWFTALTLIGCSLPERPPVEMPRDWCKEVDKNCG
jgi:hypothetical protein